MVAMATIFIVVVIPGQKSGERLQNHWSSGLFFLFCVDMIINLKTKYKMSGQLAICFSQCFAIFIFILSRSFLNIITGVVGGSIRI